MKNKIVWLESEPLFMQCTKVKLPVLRPSYNLIRI